GSTRWPVPHSAPSSSRTSSTLARATPSTSTLMVPSGSLSSCSTWARVPTGCRSPAPGSSVSADFWATSRTCLLPSMARSSARMDLSRPTNSGMTMCGNTTTSRRGRTGRSKVVWEVLIGTPARGARRGAAWVRLWGPGPGDASGGSCVPPVATTPARPFRKRRGPARGRAPRAAWRVSAGRRPRAGSVARSHPRRGRAGGLVDQVRIGLVLDHGFVHHHLADILQRRQGVHGVQQNRLDDGPQPARAGLALQCLARDGGQGVGAELQLHALHLEQLAELLGDGVLGLGEDLDQRRLVQLLERGDHGQAADELRDQAELDQVLRLDVGQHLADLRLALAALDLGAEADATGLGGALLDDLVEAGEGAAHDEQDVAGVDLQELLLRVLAAALRRDAGDGALDELQQRLLHALARHVAGDRRVLALARDLVDLVDVDDALLRLLDVVVALLQQLLDDVLDVLADVPGLGQRGRVGHGERDVQHAGQGLGQQGLAGTGGAHQQDVGLG